MNLTFFGHSAWGLESAGARLLIDPYPVSTAAASLLRNYAAAACDGVLVTHGARDHIGIALELVERSPQTALISEPAVISHAKASGVDSERCLALVWNGERDLGDWHVRAVETRHASYFESINRVQLSGIPLGFIVWHASEPDLRILHLGDTSLFSDLRLIGTLYAPTVGLIGVGAALGYFQLMSAEEGAQAALWLGVDVALPMHCEVSPAPAQAFCAAIERLPRKVSTWVPELGESFRITRETSIALLPKAEPPR